MLSRNNSEKIFSFNKYIIRIAKLYICIVLVNISDIYEKNILIVDLPT